MTEKQVIAADRQRRQRRDTRVLKLPARGTDGCPKQPRPSHPNQGGWIKSTSHPCMTLWPDAAACALIPQSHDGPVWGPRVLVGGRIGSVTLGRRALWHVGQRKPFSRVMWGARGHVVGSLSSLTHWSRAWTEKDVNRRMKMVVSDGVQFAPLAWRKRGRVPGTLQFRVDGEACRGSCMLFVRC